jgi:hypothetical protein
VSKVLALAVALAAAAPALAQFDQPLGPSPRWGSVDIGFGQYTPNIDSESFPNSAAPVPPGPYERVFGTHPGWMFTATVSYSLFARFGTWDIGFKSGYFEKSAKGLVADPSSSTGFSEAGADTALKIIPTSAVLTYRFDWPLERYKIPLAPYGRIAFERYNWWITRGSGGTVQKGATMGWSASGGLALLVDWIDPQLAREFDHESGVNHTYLFFEVVTGKIDDFGSETNSGSKSWNLSPKGFTWMSGMTFVF